MQTALRKMGNSTGMIVPRFVLREIGVTTGARMELRVENGTLVASPVRQDRRAGWADAAATIAEATDEHDWRGFDNEDDASLTW